MSKQLLIIFIAIISSVSMTTGYANNKIGMSCQSIKEKINCDVRLNSIASITSVKVALVNNGTVLKELPSKFMSYAAQTKKTALLFVVDTSDPRRKKALKQTRLFLKKIIGEAKDDTKIGIASFDSELTILVEIGSSQKKLLKGVDKLKAKGKTTELYRSTKDAVDALSLVTADRKTLILMSDGLSEDTAYNSKDVIDLAKKEEVVIYGLAFLSGSKKDEPGRQALLKLSEETGGLYTQTEKSGIPKGFTRNFYKYVDSGGDVQVEVANIYGDSKLKFTITDEKGKNTVTHELIQLPPEPETPIEDPWWVKYKTYLIGFGGFILLVFLLRFAFRKRKIIYAKLETLDANPKFYEMTNDIIRLGRNKKCDIKLENDSVSSFHADIKFTREGEFIVSDINSLNGTRIDDADVGQDNNDTLFDGSILELGEVRLRFHPVVGGGNSNSEDIDYDSNSRF